VEIDGFSYLVSRSNRATIDAREPAALQKIAAALLALGTAVLDHSVIEGELKEMCDEENPPAI
jgi:hypothetical protein